MVPWQPDVKACLKIHRDRIILVVSLSLILKILPKLTRRRRKQSRIPMFQPSPEAALLRAAPCTARKASPVVPLSASDGERGQG